jgi:hypothetical protein
MMPREIKEGKMMVEIKKITPNKVRSGKMMPGEIP